MCYADEMRCEVASTGHYGYYYGEEEQQETDDGEWIDIEYERDCERRMN